MISILAACLMLFSFIAPANAQKQKEVLPAAIVSDVIEDGLRTVNYRPDDIVCSVNIEIQLRGDVIESVKYTRGCNGNATPLYLYRTLPVGGGLLVPYSLSRSPVLKQLMQMVTMVPGQGGRFQSVCFP